MIKLSVNVNKVATVRNSRGEDAPSVIEAVEACLSAGAPGITVHPRADSRHIVPADVREIATIILKYKSRIDFNIEGDPRPDLLELVLEVLPDQCTLVPVRPGEITSQAGWLPTPASRATVTRAITRLKAAGIRVSLFVDPDEEPIKWAADIGADRVELYTEPYARAYKASTEAGLASFNQYARAAISANTVGLGINAGHDLNLENLTLFRQLPHLKEVSIGHALISRAIFVGLQQAVREYLEVINNKVLANR